MEIAEQLRMLEMELLSAATRKDAERVSALLADTFREFGSSGRVYTKEEILFALQEETSVSIAPTDWKIVFLSEEIALVTYRSVREQRDTAPVSALRSSIWVRRDGQWRMVFHQGTIVPAFV